jgi:fucose permease
MPESGNEAVMVSEERSSKVPARLPLYVGFAATGVGVTQPGAQLPLLLQRWHMDDSRGGVLLFCFFVGASLGALCSRGRMELSLARGGLLSAAGALSLLFAGPLSAFAAVFVFGLGLGIAMTSVSLVLSRRFPEDRRVELTRLNLVWALGATLGPWLALRRAHSSSVLAGLAVVFAALGAWAWMTAPAIIGPGGEPDEAKTTHSRGALPWPLLVLVFGATGVESAAGGWLTTFAQRNADSLGTTIRAATLLWVGLLAGRALHSTRRASRWNELTVLRGNTLAMLAATTLLIAWPAGAATMAAALVLGFALGPMYPLLLAMVLRQREHGIVFVIAGAGSSVLPLLTGEISGRAHSLRAGLGVPLLAAAAMVVMALRWQSPKPSNP